jgi:hypothetical protein
VDLHGDGHLDLISGSWPGEIFLFRGKGKGQFEAPVKLKDKNGKRARPGHLRLSDDHRRPDPVRIDVVAKAANENLLRR